MDNYIKFYGWLCVYGMGVLFIKDGGAKYNDNWMDYSWSYDNYEYSSS